jgi:hypothetical protein
LVTFQGRYWRKYGGLSQLLRNYINPRTVIAFYHTNGFMWVRWDPHVNELGELGFLPILH